jgi:hypothetical protein
MIVQRVALTILLLVSLSIFVYTDTLRSRIASSVPHSRTCLYNLVADAAPRARIIITGSSRARQSVDPDILADRAGLNRRDVVNAAHPSRNPWLDLVVLSHAGESGDLKLAIVEMQVGSPAVRRREIELKGPPAPPEQLLRLTSGTYPRNMITALSYSQTILVLSQKAAAAPSVVYDILNAVLVKLEDAMKPLLSGQIRKLLVFGEPNIDPKRRNVCWLTDVNRPGMQSGTAQQQAIKQMARERFLADNPGGILSVSYDTNEFLTGAYAANRRDGAKRITALARERGLRLVFYYLPAYYTPPPSPDFQAEFEHSIGAPLLVPGRKTLATLYPYYYDMTHLNITGMRIFTNWIAGELEMRGLIGGAG